MFIAKELYDPATHKVKSFLLVFFTDVVYNNRD